MSDAEVHSGGCQCGAVRYRFTDISGTAHVCHCRMCQKAVGGFYAAWIEAVRDSFEVTRGELSYFQSSDEGQRGFCAACGTPLVFAHTGGEWLAVTIGSLDRPNLFPPVDQHGVEGRHGFVNGIGALPDRPATEAKEPETAARIRASNHQHPDHDTEIWPLEGGAHG
jgi:hypothetical protein